MQTCKACGVALDERSRRSWPIMLMAQGSPVLSTVLCRTHAEELASGCLGLLRDLLASGGGVVVASDSLASRRSGSRRTTAA